MQKSTTTEALGNRSQSKMSSGKTPSEILLSIFKEKVPTELSESQNERVRQVLLEMEQEEKRV